MTIHIMDVNYGSLSLNPLKKAQKTKQVKPKGDLPKVHWVQDIHHIWAGEFALNQVSWHRVTWALLLIWRSRRSHKGSEFLWNIIPLGTRVEGVFLPGFSCLKESGVSAESVAHIKIEMESHLLWTAALHGTPHIMWNISSLTSNIQSIVMWLLSSN